MGARVSPPTAAGHADERIRRDAVQKRSIYVAVAAALAILGAAVVSPAVAGQEASGDAEVRIVARKLDSGRIEFGLQQRQTDDTWGDRQLPRVRFFPTTARFTRWLASSPLTLVAPQSAAPQSAARVAAVVSGGAHSCALRTDRTVTCWGWNEHRQTDAPDGEYTAITAGWGHSCALRTNGIITCWGNNDSGQTDAPNGQYTAIAAGVGHSCALGTDRTITCWGNNASGQTDDPDGQYTAVAAGGGHSCALGTDRTITCWGNNASGHLGQQRLRADRRTRRAAQRRRGRRRTLVRAGHRPHHHLLGQQPLRAGRRPHWAVQRRHSRLGPLVRAGRQRHHHLLG